MPLSRNPWARNSEPDVEEWLHPKDDVVEDFLTYSMIRASNKTEELSVDSSFSR